MKKNKLFIVLVFIFLSAFIISEIYILSYSKNLIPEKSDAVLILGHALKDGYNPDKLLIERLNKGLELYEKGYGKYIIVSGKQGPNDTIPVSVSMKNWLMEHNVPENIILTETKSGNTYENFKYSKETASLNNIKSIIVVTNDFHMFRSLSIAKMFFEKVSAGFAESDFSLDYLIFTVKEPFSVLNYYLFFAR